MLIKPRRGWEIPEREVTAEALYLNRRSLLKAGGYGLIAASVLPALRLSAFAGAAPLRNPLYKLDRPLTAEKLATSYNNFYEFGTDKDIVAAAQALKPRPWTIKIDGMVAKEQTLDLDDLLKKVNLEERVYRHRCVETWSMAVPWTGFPMRQLVALAQPQAGVKYVRMESFSSPDIAPEQSDPLYPWPYVEGLTLAEATNDLTFLATGIYGAPLPAQNGTPIRLVTPWKYGFKSAKSLVKFTFTDRRPNTFWQQLGPSEYGFWANVNPDVPHPRWSQATEKPLGSSESRPTLIWNGYGDYVASLYQGLERERLFA